MTNRFYGRIAAVIFAISLPGIASAWTIYDDFGAFPDATWGGTGIPNDAVAASLQIVNGEDTIRIAMSAHGRYSNPLVTNNGAAIYTAGTGSNFGGAGESADEGALWNWTYFVDISGPSVLADYQIDLYYDLDPAGSAFGDLSGLGHIDFTALLLAGDPAATLVEGSQNNLFGFLAVDSFGIDAPNFVAFNPNEVGNYQYAITVSRAGFGVDVIAMEVNVIPIPAAVWLFGSALGFLGWTHRHRTV